jgi:hypothetical protein
MEARVVQAETAPPDPEAKAVRVVIEVATAVGTADPVAIEVETVEVIAGQAETAVPTAPSKSISTN